MQLAKCALGLAAVETLPLLFLADTVLARWRGWQFVSRFEKLAALSVASIAVLSLVLVLVRKGRRFYQNHWPRLLLLIVAVSSSVLVGELVSRVVRPEPELEPFHGHLPDSHWVFHPQHTVLPGVGPEAHFSTNSLGIRGSEVPDDPSVVKVLCLGGSTTECLFLDDTKTWTRQLMLMLSKTLPDERIWVGDMGHAGYSSTMHLRFVETSPIMHIIDDLVILVGFNDLQIALFRWLTQDELLDNEVQAPIWCRSRALELTGLHPHTVLRQVIVNDQDSGGTFLVNLRKRRRNGLFQDHLPNLDVPLEQYSARLRSIVTRFRAKGVRPVLLTQPVLWSDHLSVHAVSLLWLGWTHDGHFLTVRALSEAMERFNDVLVRVCQEMGADYVDLRSMSGKEEFFYDDCHLTEAGSHELARLISVSFHPKHPVRSAR
jgi:GDSL-like Lipase/Acylhydrolase family